MPTLYRAQQAFVDSFCARPQKRAILVADTGCGKTAMALAVGRKLELNRVLIVTLADVRRHWAAEVDVWWPERRSEVGVIKSGRATASTGKAEAARRNTYFACPVQIVSYDLLHHVDARGWDFLVFDEIHELGNPCSKQSRIAKALTRSNPQTVVLGLSATPIPTRVGQIWNPYDTVAPNSLGAARPRTGDIPWPFLSKYTNLISNEHGTAEGPARLDMLPALEQRLAPLTHRVKRSDINSELPPLLVDTLVREKSNGAAQDALEWLERCPPDIKRVIILPHFRQSVATIVSALQAFSDRLPEQLRGAPIRAMTGDMPTEARARCREMCAQDEAVILVATQDCCGVGVRFMWSQQALVLEHKSSPGQMTQLIGRFQSVGSTNRPQVFILATQDEAARAGRLVKRLRAINTLYAAGASEEKLEEILTAKPEEIVNVMKAAFAAVNLDVEDWGDNYEQD